MFNKFNDFYDNYGCGWVILAVLITLALAFGIMCLEAWVFMLLLNWLVPLVVSGFAISFWQSFGLILLLDIVGGFFKKRITHRD
jgi:hypothetical protein